MTLKICNYDTLELMTETNVKTAVVKGEYIHLFFADGTTKTVFGKILSVSERNDLND